MDIRTGRIFTGIIITSWLFSIGFLVFKNKDGKWLLLLLSIIPVFSFIVKSIPAVSTSAVKNLKKSLYIMDILLVYWVNFLDISYISRLYFFIIASDAVIYTPMSFNIIFAAVSFLSLLVIINLKFLKWNYFDFWYLWPVLLENSFYFIFITGIMYVVRNQVKQKQILKKTAEELKEQKIQLEYANSKLNETIEALEEITVLKERNRIARDIHDLLGHALTSVLVEIEAGKRLISRNQALSEEKLELAQEQIRKCLNDIRESVRTLKDGGPKKPFIGSIKILISETERHTGVKVESSIRELHELTDMQEKAFYSALQEGLTNGIRHGKSTLFVFEIFEKDGMIEFYLRDNGRGSEAINPGFGLTAIKERAEELGGDFSIFSSKGGGCCLSLKIPVRKEGLKGLNENDKHIDS